MIGILGSMWRQAGLWVCLFVFVLAASDAHGVEYANSVTEYSGIQGTLPGQWQYGYYDGLLTPATFKLMTSYSPPSAPNKWVVDYDLPAPYYWTWLEAIGGHPNSTNSGARTPAEQWAVRRWVSDVTGAATIRGIIADLDSRGGNGIVARIYNGATQIFSLDLANGASIPNYAIPVNLVNGQAIDFVIDPKSPSDFFDSTKFTAIIDTDPIVGATPTLLGDYNANGVVDAPDYVLWRKLSGQSVQLPNEVPTVTPGQVTAADYTEWRNRFGNGSPGSGSVFLASVPEPSTLLLLVAGLAMLGNCRCERRQ